MHRVLAVAVMVAAVVSSLVVPAGSAVAAECRTSRTTNVTFGDHHNWRVETAINEADTPTWRVRQEVASRGATLDTDASGTGRKDDLLISDEIVAGPTTTVTIDHDWLLGAGAGAVLEITTDGGLTWQDAGALITDGGYDGTVALEEGNRPAWTGAGAAPLHIDETATFSQVDLSPLAGQRLQLAWRLLQNATQPTPGAYWALFDVAWQNYLDPACVDSGQVTCLQTFRPEVTVVTPTNTDGTPAWRQIPELGEYTTSAAGLRPKDDQLVTAPFQATPTTHVNFAQRFETDAGHDGGILEYRAEDMPWEQVPAEWFLLGGYNGALADGRPAWTGLSSTHPELVRPSPEWFFSTAATLAPLAGLDVQLRLRLLQDDVRPGATPGTEWTASTPRVADAVGTGCTSDPVFDVEPPDCLDEAPDSIDVRGVTDDGSVKPLHVRVLLDVREGIDIAQRTNDPASDTQFQEIIAEHAALLAPAGDAYERLGVDLQLTFDLFDPFDGNGNVWPPVQDSQELIDRAKAQYGGERPAGVDVVYVASDLDGLQGSVAGQADCIGGVRYQSAAFAAGRSYRNDEVFVFPGGLRALGDMGAKVLAHEVGHLLGAHHHYANCVEAAPTQLPRGEVTGGCTTMIPDIGLAWLHFSTLSGSVMRGYVNEFTGE